MSKSTEDSYIFAQVFTISEIYKFYFLPSKSWSRTKSKNFAMTAFDGKCQNLHQIQRYLTVSTCCRPRFVKFIFIFKVILSKFQSFEINSNVLKLNFCTHLYLDNVLYVVRRSVKSFVSARCRFSLPLEQKVVAYLSGKLPSDHHRRHHRRHPLLRAEARQPARREDVLSDPTSTDHPRRRLLHAESVLLRQSRNDPSLRRHWNALEHALDRVLAVGRLRGRTLQLRTSA